MEFNQITEQYLSRVETVQYSELPQVKICPHILDYVSEDICDLLKKTRPKNYKKSLIGRGMLWKLSNNQEVNGVMIDKKFQGQSIWEHSALTTYITNKCNRDANQKFKDIQLEHNNERKWYTERLESLDTKDPHILQSIKQILSTTTCTVVTKEFHAKLPNGITDPTDPFKRYRSLDPTLYWIDWTKMGRQWKIERVRRIQY